MRKRFEVQRKAGMNVDWQTWQQAWYSALSMVSNPLELEWKVSKEQEFLNESQNEFTDISSEQFRVYEYLANGKKVSIRIPGPMRLSVSASGGHRVFDANGVSHYMAPGFVHIYWKAKSGSPNFVA